ncbi:hypothetical protein ACR6C2_38475 [Streptomyces sp. INA 01156]
MTREEELPILRFSQLSVDEIQQQLRTLSQSDLTVIEGYGAPTPTAPRSWTPSSSCAAANPGPATTP